MTSEILGGRFIAIHQAFTETEYGHKLAANIRYERYKPKSVSNERWVELLGADVNNLTHLQLTYGLTRSFIIHQDEVDPSYLSDQERQTLLVAALIHDWGEAMVGDLSWDEKDDSAEAKESAAFDGKLSDFYPEGSDDIKAMIKSARDEIIFNPKSRLGRLFNAIERVGYIRTALRASEHVISGDAPDCKEGLRWIVGDVFGNHIIKALEYANDYPPVHRFLADQVGKINTAFTVVTSDVFANYKPEQRGQEKIDFINARLAWDEWAKSQSADNS